MKRAIYSSILLALLVTISRAQSRCFLENKGQWDPQAKYLLHSRGMNLWITDSGIVYDLYKNVAETFRSRSERGSHANSSRDLKVTASRSGQVVRMSFLRAAQPDAIAKNPESGATNYFIGNDPSKWVIGARSFESVTIQHLYDGVDAKFSLDHGAPRYDLVVQPGFDPSQIEMQIEGADSIRSNGPDGRGTSLRIYTAMGTIDERELFAYQEVNGMKQRVDCKFHISNGNHVSFQLGAFDHAKPLIIDPLIFSTYLGGGGDIASAIVVDRFGNSYVTGWTASQNFPVTTGAYQTSNNGSYNVFIAKLNASGSALIFATYLGGSGDGWGYGNGYYGYYDYGWGKNVAIDSAGNVYVTGETDAKDFPTTSSAFQRFSKATNSGYYSNAFVAKLNPTGTALVYSTYLGGSNGYWDGEGEWASGIAVDSIGEAFVVGTTSSSDFPVTSGAFQTKNLNFSYNIESDGRSAFITKLNAKGSGLIYSTYLGGSENPSALPGDAASNGNAIAIDRAGNAFVAGVTVATDFPVTPGAFETIDQGSYGNNSFVTKLNSTGTALLYSTYLGGTDSLDEILGIALDTLGEAFVTGLSGSTDFPVTSGAFQQAKRGKSNAFVTKLNAAGSGLIYSTYLGSTGSDVGTGIAIDDSGDAYIAGGTGWSNDFPTLPGAIQTQNRSEAMFELSNAFVTELNPSGSALLYSTYLGSTGADQANGIAVDSSHNVYVVGETSSFDFPVTPGALQVSNPDTSATAFVTKLSPLTMYLTSDTSLRDLGAGSLCRTADTSVVFTNSGTDSLLIKQIAIKGQAFSLIRQPSSDLLLPGESDTATLEYTPTAAGSDSATLEIETNAANDSQLFVPIIARTLPPLAFHIAPSLSRASVAASDTTTLWLFPDTVISNNLGLNSLEFALRWNSDLLTPLSIASAVPGAAMDTFSQTKDGVTSLGITLSGSSMNLTPSQPIATIVYDASVTDSASTQISVGNPILNGNIDSSYTRCILDAAGSSTLFSLKFSCGDSLIMAALNNRLLVSAISIYPNPTTGLFHIESTSNDIVITDLLGRTWLSTPATASEIDVSCLPQGVYTISDGKSRAQFVKE